MSASLTITLVPSLVGRSDASRLIRELEGLDNIVTTQRIHQQAIDVSRTTTTLAELATANKMNLAEDDDRTSLKQQLKLLKTKGSVLHVVFAEEPEPEIMHRITAWVREQLHPQALLRAGLQPGIVAGCSIRTPSHIYDFSIASVLKAKRPILARLMQEAKSKPLPAAAAEEHAPAATIPQGAAA